MDLVFESRMLCSMASLVEEPSGIQNIYFHKKTARRFLLHRDIITSCAARHTIIQVFFLSYFPHYCFDVALPTVGRNPVT